MAAARIDLCEVSPITQRSASSRFDLPQPLGPTTPVKPVSIISSVGSTNDLKPIRRSFVMCTSQLPLSYCDRVTDEQTVAVRAGPVLTANIQSI